MRGKHHALVDDLFGGLAEVAVGVLLHLAHDQFLIERTAIHADADRLAVVARNFADRGELLVAALAVAHVSGIDAVLIERAGAIGIFGQQNVAVVVKIADDGRVAARVQQPLLDFGHGGRRFRHVHGDADEFRSGLGEFEALLRGGGDVGGVGVGHRLDDHRRAAADLDLADFDADGLMTLILSFEGLL